MRTAKPLHERLQQLDRELARERAKAFDYLIAVRKGLKIRVCIMRDEDGRFYATSSIGRRAFRAAGVMPSDAYRNLSIEMRVHLASLPSRERAEIFESAKQEELCKTH